MKELEKYVRDSEKQAIESVIKKKQQVELKYESSLIPQRGHILFEINTVTGKIIEADYLEERDINWEDAIKGMDGGFKKELVQRKNCIYISALNEQSAIRRYKEGKGSAERKKGTETMDFI